jgi:hypothetical protein
MNRYIKALGSVIVAGMLAACGGGGGSPGNTGGTGGGTTDPVGSGTGTTTTPSGSISVRLFNSRGVEVTSIDTAGGYVARASVTNASDAPETNRLVTFALTDASVATVNPSTAITNTAGVAQVSIAPTSLTSLGAATLSATAVVGTVTLTATRDFGVTASNLVLGPLQVGSTSLPSAGNTPVSITASVNGRPSTTPVNVTFSATCGRINGQPGSVSTTTNGSGVASSSYAAVQADGSLCSGSVTLTATAAGAAPRTQTITVAAPRANAVTFVTADPSQIFVAGSGALEQSVVTFKVLAGTAPLSNQDVTFRLTINPGGVGLNAAGSTTPVTATTDSEGLATVSVFSGTIPGPVRVRAELTSNPAVFAESQNLTVASGPPSQRFMSLSAQNFNIEGADIDGTATTLTVRLADRQGNAVEDGTVVNFTSEGGQVASNCATQRVNGISLCSVTFISQEFRPANGRVSVLAFTSGTKDYVDVNGNNRYDAGTDTLIDMGDAYRDDNEDGTFNAAAGEFVIPRGGSRACPPAGAPYPSRANTCDNQLATTVRQQLTLTFSSSFAAIKAVSVTRSQVSFNLTSDYNSNLPMAAGTSVAGAAKDNTDNSLSCAISRVSPGTVINVAPLPDPNADRSTRHTVELDKCAAGDQVFVIVTSPSGAETNFSFTLP